MEYSRFQSDLIRRQIRDGGQVVALGIEQPIQEIVWRQLERVVLDQQRLDAGNRVDESRQRFVQQPLL